MFENTPLVESITINLSSSNIKLESLDLSHLKAKQFKIILNNLKQIVLF